MRQSHLIVANGLIIWATRVLLLFPQVILVPYLIRTIGEAGYGVYALIWSLLMAIDRLERSLQSGVVKYSAAFLARDRIDDVNRIVSSSFVYSLLLGVIAAVGIFTAAFISGPTGDLGYSLFVVAVVVLFIIPLTPYIALIQSRQRYYVGAIADAASKYLTLGIIFAWFSLAKPSVEALILITAVMLLFSRLVQAPIAYRLVPGLRNRPGLFDQGAFRLILGFGGMTVFIAICGIANTTGVRWLMAWLVSTSFIAHLAIILMPGTLLTQIVHAMTITVMPATSAYEATGNVDMLQELLVRSMRYTAVIVLAGVLVAVLLVKDVLALWVGPDYVFLGPYALALFAGMGFLLTTSSAHHMLKGLGKLRTVVSIQLIGNVIVPGVLILALFFTLDDSYLSVTLGLVAGDIAAGVLTSTFAVKAVRAGARRTLIDVYGQPLIAAAVAGAPAFMLLAYGGIQAFAARMGVATLATFGFLAQMYFVFATPAERRLAGDIAGAAWRRIRGIVRNVRALRSSRA